MMRLMFINTKRTHEFSVKLDDDKGNYSYDDDDCDDDNVIDGDDNRGNVDGENDEGDDDDV